LAGCGKNQLCSSVRAGDYVFRLSASGRRSSRDLECRRTSVHVQRVWRIAGPLALNQTQHHAKAAWPERNLTGVAMSLVLPTVKSTVSHNLPLQMLVLSLKTSSENK
jgi:hypothetical protein